MSNHRMSSRSQYQNRKKSKWSFILTRMDKCSELPPVRACLFDMDGLLIDTEDIYSEVTNIVLRECGKPELPWSIKAQLQGRPGPAVSPANCFIGSITDYIRRPWKSSGSGRSWTLLRKSISTGARSSRKSSSRSAPHSQASFVCSSISRPRASRWPLLHLAILPTTSSRSAISATCLT